MKHNEHKRIYKIVKKSKLTPKQFWRLKDFIADIEGRCFWEGYWTGFNRRVSK